VYDLWGVVVVGVTHVLGFLKLLNRSTFTEVHKLLKSGHVLCTEHAGRSDSRHPATGDEEATEHQDASGSE